MKGAKLGDGIFKAYDIRGVYPKELDETTAEAVGCSFGEYIGRGKRICVSRDVRLSSESLMRSMVKGLSGSELEIIDIGVTPTPVIYFAVTHYRLDGGVIVTASHNPPEWNGFKFFGKRSEAIGMESGLAIIRDTSRRNSECEPKPAKIENRSRKTIEDYEAFLLGKIRINGRVRIGVDPGNGSYSSIAKRVFEKAGAEVFAINDNPDGRFPARDPEPGAKSLKKLAELVVEKGLDFGIGFDPDGDRGIFVDGRGRVLRGDVAFSILVKNLLKKGEKAVYTVSCTDAVTEEIKENGGTPVVTRVGRTFVLRAMIDEKAAMGGESSGHTYFAEVYGSDDALFSGLKMAEAVSRRRKGLAELLDEMPHYESAEMELDFEDGIKFRVIDAVREKLSKKAKVITLDGVKVVTGKGWFILRASNTTPKIRLAAEARSKEDLDGLLDSAKSELEDARSKVGRRA